jgi:hypothetical protein
LYAVFDAAVTKIIGQNLGEKDMATKYNVGGVGGKPAFLF